MTKGRVVERERTAVKGQGGCWGGGDAFSMENRSLYRQHVFVRNQKSHGLFGMTKREGMGLGAFVA
jgi:hypothetical protein